METLGLTALSRMEMNCLEVATGWYYGDLGITLTIGAFETERSGRCEG
jgi:hypothetical protein